MVAVIQEHAPHLARVAAHLFVLEQLLEERLGLGIARLAGERDRQAFLHLRGARIARPEKCLPRLQGAAPVRLALVGQGELVEDLAEEDLHLGPQLGLLCQLAVQAFAAAFEKITHRGRRAGGAGRI